jgi:multiple sugar transport system permease protein
MTTVAAPPSTTTEPEETPPSRRRKGWLGEHPLGLLLSAPYLLFIGLIFAYPIVFSVWMSFQDYFFAAPGAEVDRPFVGFENYIEVIEDPAVWRSFGNVGVFLLINVPLTVGLSLLLATEAVTYGT